MSDLTKRIIEAASKVKEDVNYIMCDDKIKSDARKKMHMLDVWHRVMMKGMNNSELVYDKCIFRTYYNSFTNRHTADLSCCECFQFVLALCDQMMSIDDVWYKYFDDSEVLNDNDD